MSDQPDENDHKALLDRIRDLLAGTVRALADEAQPVPSGWLARTPSLPLVHTLNQLHITEPSTAADIAALADEHQSDLSFRHVLVDDDATTARLDGAFLSAGWKVEHEVLMALLAPPDRVADTGRVVELGEDEMSTLMWHWDVEEGRGALDDVVNQIDEYSRREGRLWNERRLGVRDPEGTAVAITKLRSDGRVAWVEDVYTLPAARGHGHARALVTRATEQARAAGQDLTFIIADDDDWPKTLYAKLGFRPVGTRRIFHKDLGPAQS